MPKRRTQVRSERPDRIRLGTILRGHEGHWVALSESMEVVASGKTIREAREAARLNGHDLPVIVWAPPSLEGYQL